MRSGLCPTSLSGLASYLFCASVWLAVTGLTCRLACRLVRLSYLKVVMSQFLCFDYVTC
jgi:hypothetical protein